MGSGFRIQGLGFRPIIAPPPPFHSVIYVAWFWVGPIGFLVIASMFGFQQKLQCAAALLKLLRSAVPKEYTKEFTYNYRGVLKMGHHMLSETDSQEPLRAGAILSRSPALCFRSQADARSGECSRFCLEQQ